MSSISRNSQAFFRSFCVTVATVGIGLFSYEYSIQQQETAQDVTVEEAVETIQNSVKYDLEPFAFDALFKDTYHLRQQINFLSSEIERHSRSTKNTKSLATLIVTESLRAQVDPLFIASVIRSESCFKNHAVSYKGAQGLMQITPATGAYISQHRKIPWRGVSSLHDPSINVRIGIEYLKYLDRKFAGNREKVLIAYNWGPGNLQEASRSRKRVPGESVQYARTILSTHKKWKSSMTGYAANLPAQTLASLG